MEIQLSKCGDEKNKLNKTLTDTVTYEGVLKENCSVRNPIITINSPGPISIIQKNYCYIPLFTSAYFIDDIIILENGLYELHLTKDLLMSYKPEIQSLHVRVARTSNVTHQNKLLVDPLQRFLPSYSVDIINSLDLPFGTSYTKEEAKLPYLKDYYYVLEIISTKKYTYPDESGSGSSHPDFFSVTPKDVLLGNGISKDRYIVNSATILRIQAEVLSNSEYASQVVSITLFPFNIMNIFANDTIVPDIYVESQDFDIGSAHFIGYYIKENARLFNYINYLIVKNSPQINLNSYIDCAPYTKYSVYLPYYGNIDIPFEFISMIKNGSICLNTFVDWSGSLVYYLYFHGEENILIDKVNVDIGIQLSLSTSNHQEIERNQYLKLVGGITDSVASVGNVVHNGISGNIPGAVIGGVTSVSNLIGTAVEIALSPNPTYRSSSTTGYSKYSDKQQIVVYKIKTYHSMELSDINSIYGTLSYKFLQLNSTNFNDGDIIYIADCHINIQMYETEYDELLTILQNGIIY